MDNEWANNPEKVMDYCLEDAKLALDILEHISVLQKYQHIGGRIHEEIHFFFNFKMILAIFFSSLNAGIIITNFTLFATSSFLS